MICFVLDEGTVTPIKHENGHFKSFEVAIFILLMQNSVEYHREKWRTRHSLVFQRCSLLYIVETITFECYQ